MKFENLDKTWESFGKNDPLWAILTWEGKKNNNWDVNEFFQIGVEEIKYVFHESEKRKKIKCRGKSLDFGCGVGRLTFPLGEFFEESHGLDISSAMIQKADVTAFIEKNGGTILDVVEDLSCGLDLKSYRYFVTK